jgi:hypothetical protein
MIADLNQRYLRARLPKLRPDEAERLAARLLEDGGRHEGISHEDLIRIPHPSFFRRKGEPAFTMVGTRGEAYTDVESYLRHLKSALPEPYLHSRDMKMYLETLRDVVAGRVPVDQAIRKMPKLKRVGGMCPCSKSVRWVMEEETATAAVPTKTAPAGTGTEPVANGAP